MLELSRRQYLRQLGALAGTAAVSSLSAPAFAADTEIPPQGIGKGIKHISYSDIGGRPDSVQVMANRGHLFVGHMFSNGLTVLNASDPRNLKPVEFFTGGDQAGVLRGSRSGRCGRFRGRRVRRPGIGGAVRAIAGHF